jgi:PleD family two-component response regulator
MAPSVPLTRRLHILVAEDNVVNQRLAAGILEKRGHHITIVADGQAAVTGSRRDSTSSSWTSTCRFSAGSRRRR